MKVVILAAGKGTRLHPLTLTRPKHLVPIGGKPIIDHVLLSLKTSGIDEALFIINYRAEQIKQYLGDGTRYDMRFEYAYQKELRGTADAASFAESYVKGDFLLSYGDWLITPKTVETVLKTHQHTRSTVTMGIVPVENPEHYGIVELEDSMVTSIIEKPARKLSSSNMANAGLYVLSEEIFDAIRRTKPSPRKELEITDSLRLLLEKGHSIAGATLPNNEVFDVGLLWDICEANQWVLQRAKPSVEGNIEEGTHILGTVIIEKGARIRSGAYIEGPVFIGSGCDIGPNCFIRPFTSIGRYTRIGNACEIKNSIIMDKTHVGHLSYVGDSILGENCNLGAGTIVANYRFDGKTVKMSMKNERLDTGRRKLGVILGDNVRTGINTLFMPGVRIGNNCWIGPDVLVRRDIEPSKIVLVKQELQEHTKTEQSGVLDQQNPKKL